MEKLGSTQKKMLQNQIFHKKFSEKLTFENFAEINCFQGSEAIVHHSDSDSDSERAVTGG